MKGKIMKSEMRRFLAVGGISLLIFGVAMPGAALAQPDFARDGEVGFLVWPLFFGPFNLAPPLVFQIPLDWYNPDKRGTVFDRRTPRCNRTTSDHAFD